MIICYEGLLGGGKSYHAVQHALRYMAKGGHVFTNIDLNREACESYCRAVWGREIDFPGQYHHVPNERVSLMHKEVIGGTPDCHTLAIFDELHLFCNARDWAQTSRDLLTWLTQTRKLYTDVIFISQHRNNVDKQFLRLVGEFYRFRDMRNWVLFGIKWHLPMFLVVQMESDGRTITKKRWESIDKDIFSCYTSDQTFSQVGDKGLKRIDTKRTKRSFFAQCKRFAIYAVSASVLFGIVYGAYSLIKLKWRFLKAPVVQAVSPPSDKPLPSRSSPSRSSPPARSRVLVEPLEVVLCNGRFEKACVAGAWTHRPPDFEDCYVLYEDRVPPAYASYIVADYDGI